MFGIDVIYMRFIDKAALDILKAKVNPQTNRADLNINQLAEELLISRRTASRITDRLQAAGHILKHKTRGCGGAEIEVFAQSE